ncbi:hypothetical protein TBR22_A05990 [Luteitalea sp. TBR-22]|uniref:hypothetical protein n=1 Tax=Luteitalea sp. TBR-22 TaxID=2802971 RepID=UPI001AF72ACD|nr:hypothetical protein [Luteitalea sp. TBR-22]BCS31398.1 hypothetical protein TBR22_A05990 [Luteitalea sp. TBR-22]
MTTYYTDTDKLLLERWQEVNELIEAREELIDRIDDVVEVAGQLLARSLEPRGYAVEASPKDVAIYLHRSAWADRKKGTPVYFTLGGFAPLGYRKHSEAHPYLWLTTSDLEAFRQKVDQRIEFSRSLRKALGADVARTWEHHHCNDADEPLGRVLTDYDDRARCELVSSPEKLHDFAMKEFDHAFQIADVVERQLFVLLGR